MRVLDRSLLTNLRDMPRGPASGTAVKLEMGGQGAPGRIAQSGRATARQAVGRRFDPSCAHHVHVAQRIECGPAKAEVAGSIPAVGAMILLMARKINAKKEKALRNEAYAKGFRRRGSGKKATDKKRIGGPWGGWCRIKGHPQQCGCTYGVGTSSSAG